MKRRLHMSLQNKKNVISRIRRAIRRLAGEDAGQDLVEYAMLGVFVAVVTALALRLIGTSIANRYIYDDSSEQQLWEPPQPPAS